MSDADSQVGGTDDQFARKPPHKQGSPESQDDDSEDADDSEG